MKPQAPPETKSRPVADPRLNEFLYRKGLARRGERPVWTALAGGVSSDIWRVELGDRTVCVKRALARLRVAADWRAPAARNHFEWEWLSFVSRLAPSAAPRPLAHDEELQALAMEYLPPSEYPVWKELLLAGRAEPAFAAAVGRLLGRVHSASAGSPEVGRRFNSDEIFFSLRVEPYLLATAARHTDLAPAIQKIAEVTCGTRAALVHGDVSPKNILAGPLGPVFLDAECAWYGDPAFDAAFCLNHLLLKCAARPASTGDYMACFASFSENYLGAVDWEEPADVEARCANLLPALFLARVDGKSPAEYITGGREKELIRATARRFITRPETQLSAMAAYWRAVVCGRGGDAGGERV